MDLFEFVYAPFHDAHALKIAREVSRKGGDCWSCWQGHLRDAAAQSVAFEHGSRRLLSLHELHF